MKAKLIGIAALLLISSSVVVAEKPDPNVPNPPLQVQEYNVDANGNIAVHEQGTAKVEVQGVADVNVTGGSIDANISGGSVDANVTNTVEVTGAVGVNNFPGQQGVWVDGGELTPVNKAYYDFWEVNAKSQTDRHYFSVGPILATMIYVSKADDEIGMFFYSDTLAPAGENKLFALDDAAGSSPVHVLTFPYPVEIDGFKIACLNESLTCRVSITVLGF